MLRRLQQLGVELEVLIRYVSLNFEGIRKALKKYVKNVERAPPVPGGRMLVLFTFFPFCVMAEASTY